MKLPLAIVSVFSFVFLFVGCAQKPLVDAGRAVVIKGEVTRVRGDQSAILKGGDALVEGDRIETGADGIAIIEFAKSLGRVEVQPNAVFVVGVRGAKTIFDTPRGNVWIKINKLAAGENVELRTPTTIAGVRGTCFYTFHLGDMTGTCQCEGRTVYSNTVTGKVLEHDTDSITMTREGKVVILTAEDLKGIGAAHNHSVMPQSPLGPPADTNTDTVEKLRTLAEKKFASLK